jgi:hypothetical protein
MAETNRTDPATLVWQKATDGDVPEDECLEVAFAPNGDVHIRAAAQPEVVAVTSAAKWDAFVKGVKAGEFDHFVE